MIEAIADAVALRLERMAGMRQRLLNIHQAAEYWACRNTRCGMRPASTFPALHDSAIVPTVAGEFALRGAVNV